MSKQHTQPQSSFLAREKLFISFDNKQCVQNVFVVLNSGQPRRKMLANYFSKMKNPAHNGQKDGVTSWSYWCLSCLL